MATSLYATESYKCCYCFEDSPQDMVVLHYGTKRLHVACRECALMARKLCTEFKCPECRQPLTEFLFVRTCVQCFQQKQQFHHSRHMSLHPEYNLCWDCSQRKKSCVICQQKVDFTSPFA